MASEGKFVKKISDLIGIGNVDDGGDGYDEAQDVEDVIEEEIDEMEVDTMSYVATGANVLVLDPEVFEDAPVIVDKIKENRTVVVNLKNTEYDDGRKIFDFLQGAVYALEGSINRIAESVFILAPKSITVSKEVDRDPYVTPPTILDFDEK